MQRATVVSCVVALAICLAGLADAGTPTHEPPELTLFGDSTVTMEICSSPPEPGFFAEDPVDGVLTDNVTVSGVFGNELGTFLRTYTVINSFGLSVSANRTYIVEEVADGPILPCTPIGDAVVSSSVNLHDSSLVGDSCPDAEKRAVTGHPDPNMFTFGACPCLDQGDVVLFYIAQGPNHGRSQHLRVAEVGCWSQFSGNLTFHGSLAIPYSEAEDVAQVIRIPFYTSLAVSGIGSISGSEFADSEGGVLPLAVNSSLILDGTIHMNSRGFHGGITLFDSIPESHLGYNCTLGAGGGAGLGGHGCGSTSGCVPTTTSADPGLPGGESATCGNTLVSPYPEAHGGHGAVNGGGGGGGGFGFDNHPGGSGFGGGGNGGNKVTNVGNDGFDAGTNVNGLLVKGAGGGGGAGRRDAGGGGGGGSPCSAVENPSTTDGIVLAIGAGSARGGSGGGGAGGGDFQCNEGGSGGNANGVGGRAGTDTCASGSNAATDGEEGTPGSPGGGLVYIIASSISGSGSIQATGGNGGNGGDGGDGTDRCNGGGGGGGGGGAQGSTGGTIFLWEGTGAFAGVSVNGGSGGSAGLGGAGRGTNNGDGGNGAAGAAGLDGLVVRHT